MSHCLQREVTNTKLHIHNVSAFLHLITKLRSGWENIAHYTAVVMLSFQCLGRGLGLEILLSWSWSRSWDGVLGQKARQFENQETIPSASSSSVPPPRKRPALLSYARPPVQSDTSAASPDATLAAYITSNEPRRFQSWRQTEHLCRTEVPRPSTTDCKTVLHPCHATSARVERVFSQGGIIMRLYRAKMSDDVLEMLMHLRSGETSD